MPSTAPTAKPMPTCQRPFARIAATPTMANPIIQRNMRDSIFGRSVISAVTFLHPLQNLQEFKYACRQTQARSNQSNDGNGSQPLIQEITQKKTATDAAEEHKTKAGKEGHVLPKIGLVATPKGHPYLDRLGEEWPDRLARNLYYRLRIDSD